MRHNEVVSSEPVTVFIVDDDQAARDSLADLLRSVGLGVRTYAGMESFLETYSVDDAGCLVLDMRMPGMSGLRALEVLSQRSIRLPVIIVTGYGDVSSAVRAMKAGVVDFLEKPVRDQDLLETLEVAIARDRKIRARAARKEEFESRRARLTRREREVMDHLIRGHNTRQTAESMNLSPRTVEVHRSRVLEKMGSASAGRLMYEALELRFQHDGL